MNTDFENELPLRSYLLGKLDPEEQERLEQRLWADNSVLDELQVAEDELIDDYLEGVLSGSEAEKFQSYFLSAPERQRKLRFAKTLKRYVAAHPVKGSRRIAGLHSWAGFRFFKEPVFALSLATVLLVILVAGSWSVLRTSRLQRSLEQAGNQETQKQLDEMRARNSELTASLQREQAQRSLLEKGTAERQEGSIARKPAPYFAVALGSGLMRDVGGLQKLRIPAGTEVVRLDLNDAPEDYRQYRLTLQRVDGVSIWIQFSRMAESAAQNPPPPVLIPTNLLPPGDYVVKLAGLTSAGGNFEDARSYYFRVDRK